MNDNTIHTSAIVGVMLCWFVIAGVFLFRRKGNRGKEQKRDASFLMGLILQAIAFGITWSVRRPTLSPLVPADPLVHAAFDLLTIVLSAFSTWLFVAAVRTLGKQWSIAARLVEGHSLITTGPYRIVRHPIYAGMFGMMIATGLALSDLTALLISIPIYWIGTLLRTKAEENLLRQQFGAEFEKYSARVPAILPGFRRPVMDT